ncbi:NUDIX domain-containing protein, partial [bacterium]|nr:NUDIX domain-containing protein [bacterium]
WSGLGYYRRARNLHAGAKAVVERHGGEFPRGEADALALPGIGRYTAGAIRSIAYGERAPILDGNVMRVLCRVFGIDGVPARGAVSKRLWALAAEAVERGDPSEVNQAQMELGALVCTPRDPKCGVCPLAKLCVALAEGRTAELPRAAPKRATVDLVRAVLLVRDGDRVLLRRRGEDEPSPGLWDLPGAFEGNDAVAETTPLQVAGTLPFAVEVGEKVATVKHAVTHRRIRLDVYEAAPRAAPGTAAAPFLWCDGTEALDRALPGPARRILQEYLRERSRSPSP